jgi:hypothetical protein
MRFADLLRCDFNAGGRNRSPREVIVQCRFLCEMSVAPIGIVSAFMASNSSLSSAS